MLNKRPAFLFLKFRNDTGISEGNSATNFNAARHKTGVSMLCKRCPHMVRHGQASADRKGIDFKNMCGLAMREDGKEKQTGAFLKGRKGPGAARGILTVPLGKGVECKHHPFPDIFDYIDCEVYRSTFKSSSRKNDVNPTKDFQYSDAISNHSITDLELL